MQYQDFYRPPATKLFGNDNTLSRLIGFPKLVVYELIEYASGYPKYYVRAYERRSLDTKIQSKNVYMWVKGRYVGSREGMMAEESHGKEEYTEEISQIDVFYGSNVEYVLSQFIKRILEAQKEVCPKLEVNSEKQKGESLSSSALWTELEDSQLNEITDGTTFDKQWPCESQDVEAESYPYPYQIDSTVWNTDDWKVKTQKDISDTYDDNLNVKFDIVNEYNVKIKKQEIEFDPDRAQLFRVSLSLNEQRI